MQDEGILTVIQDDQGRECLIGGSSRFQPQESRLGIGASIEEWLRCAGVDLQWTDPGISSGSAGPVARLTGLEMAIELEYRNTHNMNFKGVVCYARVRAMQRWNTRPVLHYDYSLSNGEEPGRRTAWSKTQLRHCRSQVLYCCLLRSSFMPWMQGTDSLRIPACSGHVACILQSAGTVPRSK